jgi:hypothetical protein
MIKMNKGGGEKYLSPFWFAILIIVAGGIFGMVYVFYGSPYDVRNIEANLLLNQVADCVSYAGRISASFIFNESIQFHGAGTDFLKKCHLNFSSQGLEGQQYYTETTFYRLSDLNNSVLNIEAGNKNWLASCELQDNKKQEKLPQCVEKSFYSIDDLNNSYIIKILTIVRKTEQNAKL